MVLKKIFKRQTDITARYGGDEFIILMPNTPLESISRLVEMVQQKTLELKVGYKGHIIQTSISVGSASCIPREKDKKMSLILKADKALYKSKTRGRKKVAEN